MRTGSSHVVVEALAGTGKSTTAVGCLQQGVRGRIGFVAFNAHIAQELQGRLPPNVPACTLHSLGFAAVRKSYPNVQVDEAKLTKLAKQLLPDAYPSVRIAGEQLARLCKYTLTPETDAAALDDLTEHYGVEVDDRDRDKVYGLVAALVTGTGRDVSTIDYDDMVWLPVVQGLAPAQFDLLAVDEAQDLNRCQQELARRATKDGRLMPIGDERQAIMGFAGSDCEALPRLSRQLGKSFIGRTALPLTVTWRCPASHVEMARRIVPALEPAPGAADGEIRTSSMREIEAAVRPGDMVISRRNAPLIGLTYRLVLAGRPALMRGRDIGRGLTGLIRRLKPDDVKDLIEKLADYQEREERRLTKKGQTNALEALADRCDCLGQLAVQCQSLDELEHFITETFDDAAKPGECVVLSSIHRAKGLEAETVYVLDPKSLPLRHPKQKAWERQQESNLCYIAATRAKRTLVFEDRVPQIFS